ncbi:MAG: cytochrome P450 [Massilia sp.]
MEQEVLDPPLALAAGAAPAPRALRTLTSLPGPKGMPLLGNWPQLKIHEMHLQLEAWARQYGPYYTLQFGKRRILIVADHHAIATMLRDRPDGFSRSNRLGEVWNELGLPTGVFGANGDEWKRQRRMVMAGFDPQHVKRYFPALKEVAERLAGRWSEAARQNAAIDLQGDLMRFTVDTIAGLAFGAKVNTLQSDGDIIQRHLDKIFPAIFGRLYAPFPYWRWINTKAKRELAHSIQEVLAAVDGFVAQARERMAGNPALREHPDNLLEAMIGAADQPGSGIDDTQVAGNVLTTLLAGEDTTANTLAWMLYLLWRNPDTLARAVAEVRSVCGDARALTMEQMAELDYVEACANETMRLKPVAPQIGFQTLKDTAVGEVEVPAGTTIIAVMRHDSISEQHVNNAAVFAPERWLADGNAAMSATSAKRVSMPFGAGPRICPGRYLALLEMKMAMATLLGRFDIVALDTPDGLEAREQLSFTMTPVGLRMRLRLRQ